MTRWLGALIGRLQERGVKVLVLSCARGNRGADAVGVFAAAPSLPFRRAPPQLPASRLGQPTARLSLSQSHRARYSTIIAGPASFK
jgi:hypothetical protein